MKKLKTKLSAFKEKLNIKIVLIKYFFIDCYGWVNSLFIYVFRSIKRSAIFYGYGHYNWAQKYADKRTKNWHPEWDQAGRQQGTFPIMEVKLLVCSKLELELYKKKNIIDKKFKPRKAIKKSYYTTSL